MESCSISSRARLSIGSTSCFYFLIVVYRSISTRGPSSQCLYGVNEIRASEPLVLTEGPLDKLIFTQVVGRRIPCVATGSTGQCQGNRWVQEIKRASHVLVAFDHDKNYAGSKAAKEWRILVQGAKRLTPWAHDINDMHIQGIDINAWVDVGLEMLHNESLEHGQASAPATQVEDLPEHCFTCGKSVHEYAAEDFYYDAIGKLYCNEHSAIPRELDAWFFGGVA